MQITKVQTHRTVKHTRWLVLSKHRDGTEDVMRSMRGLVVRTRATQGVYKTYHLSIEEETIINRAFELLEPIMEGVTDMPSLKIWNKLTGE